MLRFSLTDRAITLYLEPEQLESSIRPLLRLRDIDLQPNLFRSSVSGGIVSNASENMVFLKAFFNGELFPKEYLPELYKWNKLDLKMAGLEYGCGLMRCKMAKVVELFYPNLELIGHAGISGSFAFYSPAKELFITGTLNQ